MTNNMEKDFSWYKLFRTKGFGPKSIRMIYDTVLKKGLTIQEVFEISESEFRNTFPKLREKADFNALHQREEEFRKEYQRLKQENIKIVHLGHELYPRNVIERMKNDAPPVLFCKGYMQPLKDGGISIVGSRNATEEALKIAKKFASDLAGQGINVISGYAKGIDEMAHLGALESGGITIIILSYGIFNFRKKKRFKDLHWDNNILIISQFAPTEKWSAWKAMSRNKLVCALSKAVIVIEAGKEKDEYGKMSGSFNAGKTALKMNVPLFVVDPALFRSKHLGNKQLIEEGGIKINPENGIKPILEKINLRKKNENSSITYKQRLLLEFE